MEQKRIENPKTKNILVTGGCGFIASHVIERLYKRYPNYRIVNLDKLTYCGREDNVEQHICDDPWRYVMIKGDICDKELVKSILIKYKIDTIIHLAAETHVDRSFQNSLVFAQTNIIGTHQLIQACYEVYHKEDVQKGFPGLERFIMTSSDEVYGSQAYNDSQNQYHENESLLLPTNPYSASKAASEMIVQGYIKSFDLPAIILRPNNAFGERQYFEKVTAKFIILALMGKTIPIHGDGTAKRSFLYVKDTAAAFDVILHHGNVGEIYNIGTDNEISVLELANQIIALVNKNKSELERTSITEYVRDRSFNDRRYFVNSAKIEALGWKPTTSFVEALEATYIWYRDRYQSFDAAVLAEALQAHPPSPSKNVV
jgi:UDP-glucose 4,6-dehydratase